MNRRKILACIMMTALIGIVGCVTSRTDHVGKRKDTQMNGKFLPGVEVERDELEWGSMGWLSRPATTGAGDLVVIEVVLLRA